MTLAEKIAAKKRLRLDLGCGAHKQKGTFGVDARDLPGVDLVHNLTDYPWPLPDDVAQVVFMSHFWEHLPRENRGVLRFMEELHRICEHDAQILIASPYSNEFRFVQDPTHTNPTNEATLAYWDPKHESGLWGVYQPPAFHLESFEIIPVGSFRDFNAILRCCKAEPGLECVHE